MANTSRAAFLQAKKKALNNHDSAELWQDEHCDLLHGLADVLSSSHRSNYENTVNYYLVGRKRIRQLCGSIGFPKVLTEMVLEYLDLPSTEGKHQICWACCGGKLFLNPIYDDYPNPNEVPRVEIRGKMNDLLICALCKTRYPRVTFYGDKIHQWEETEETIKDCYSTTTFIHRPDIPFLSFVGNSTIKTSTWSVEKEEYDTLVDCKYHKKNAKGRVKVEVGYDDRLGAAEWRYLDADFWVEHHWACCSSFSSSFSSSALSSFTCPSTGSEIVDQ